MFPEIKKVDARNCSPELLNIILLQKQLTLEAVMMEMRLEKSNAPKAPIFNYLGEKINNNNLEYYFSEHNHFTDQKHNFEFIKEPPLAVYIVGPMRGDHLMEDDILVWYEGMAQDLIATSL